MATPNRWAPWIEPLVQLSVETQDISTTSFTALTGVSVTVTPHVNCRVAATANIEALVFSGAPSTERLWLRILVNGTPICFFVWGSGNDSPHNICAIGTVDLAKETAYTFTIDARVSAAGPTFRIEKQAFSAAEKMSGFVLVGMPRLHA